MDVMQQVAIRSLKCRISNCIWLCFRFFFIFGFHVKFWHHKPKGSVRYILLVCFSSLKESTSETWKNVFILLRKLFSFPRKSNIKILDIQVSWNKKYILVNNLGSKQSLVMKIGQFVSYCKRKKNYQKAL